VGIENAFAAKVQMEKELAATKDQVHVVTAERDSALASPLLKVKVDSLTEQLRLAESKRLSALARMKEVEEGNKFQHVELQSCRSTLEQEEKKVKSLTRSLEQKQKALDEAKATAGHWGQEWKALAEETGEMVQETFDILMDQVRHLNPVVDYSMITLDTRWDPKGKRIYNPKAETKEQAEPAVKDRPEPVVEEQSGVLAKEQSKPLVEQQQVEEAVVGYMPGSQNLSAFYGVELVGALSKCFDHPVGAFPICF
ncbi:hypothetical protein PIB30_082263, partial [Stylosanthes scabra]|nr:hypothetical protein [Stylosanthes scabra]